MTDTLGWRKKFAVITPSANSVVQPEYDAMRPPGVTNHLFRLPTFKTAWSSDADFMEIVQQIDAGVEVAVDQALTCNPDHLVLGVSFESVWRGGLEASRALHKRMSERAGGKHVTLAGEAVQAALLAFGISRRVGLVTPYFPVGVPHVVGFLESMGYQVVSQEHLPTAEPAGISRVSEQQLRDSFRRAAQHEAEAIVQFGANLPAMRVAAEGERWLGIPIISINTATYWRALRDSGIADKMHGFGRLLSEH